MGRSVAEWESALGLNFKGIVHVGAHYAEEREIYSEYSLEPVLWIEALESVAEVARQNLMNYPNQVIITATLSENKDEIVDLYHAGAEDSSSSIFMPHLIKASHPDVKVNGVTKTVTSTLDSVLEKVIMDDSFPWQILVLDVQGAELAVLKGALKYLHYFQMIVCEVSIRELYKEAALFQDVTDFLAQNNFSLVTESINQSTGWGEGLYVCTQLVSKEMVSKFEVSSRRRRQLNLGTRLRQILVRSGLEVHWFKRPKLSSIWAKIDAKN
jgi:FkbM family methyltransferase